MRSVTIRSAKDAEEGAIRELLEAAVAERRAVPALMSNPGQGRLKQGL